MAELKPCGTPAAYRRHLRHGETPCQACTDAEAERQRSPDVPRRTSARHGTNSRYTKGCRCAPCTEAHRLEAARWRAAVAGLPEWFVPHGVSGYNEYGCRCAVCVEAKREDNARAYQARRRAAR